MGGRALDRRRLGLVLLGRSSLAVFTTHLPFAFLSRGLIVGEAPLTLAQQAGVLVLTFGAMLRVRGMPGGPGRPKRGRGSLGP